MAQSPDRELVLQAFSQIVRPLLRLAVDRGVSYTMLDEALRRLLVAEARAQHPDAPAHGIVSRISTTTGLNRREVTRLIKAPAADSAPEPRWLAGEVFTRWLTDSGYQTTTKTKKQPRVLPRQGAAPSFEALAQSVTRDVHPRSLLEELQRLGMVRHDTEKETVEVARNAFVPSGDFAALMAFLTDNVADHMQAAAQNVLHKPAPHFEQAIYADALCAASIEGFKDDILQQWRQMLTGLVPRLEALAHADRARPEQATQRLRIGLYSYSAPMRQDPSEPVPDDPPPASHAAPPRQRRSSTPTRRGKA